MKWQPIVTAANADEANRELVPSLAYPLSITASGNAGDNFITVQGDITSINFPKDTFACPDNQAFYASELDLVGGNTIVYLGTDTVRTTFTNQTCYTYSYGETNDSQGLANELHLQIQNVKKQIGERFEVSYQDGLGASHSFRGSSATGYHIASQVGFAGPAGSRLSLNWSPSLVPQNCMQYWLGSGFAELYVGGAVNPITGANHSDYPDIAIGNQHTQYIPLDGGTPSQSNYITNVNITVPDDTDADTPMAAANHIGLSWSEAHGSKCIPVLDSWYISHSLTPLGTSKTYGSVTRYVVALNSGTYSVVPPVIDSIQNFMLWPNAVASAYQTPFTYLQYNALTTSLCQPLSPVMTNIAVGPGSNYGLIPCSAYWGNVTDNLVVNPTNYFAVTLPGAPTTPNGTTAISVWTVTCTVSPILVRNISFTLNGTVYNLTNINMSQGQTYYFIADVNTNVTIDSTVAAYLNLTNIDFIAKSTATGVFPRATISSFSAKYIQGASSAS